ncbi:MAG: hypothetical protein WCJ30_05125 [Deltaproteobacteria bacterium]
MTVFDLARRFALLEPAAGAGAFELVRVAVGGRSRACPRCGWWVMAWDATCENCGLPHAATAPTENVAVPEPEVRVEMTSACAVPETLAARRGEPAYGPCEAVPSRLAMCAGPARFRLLAREWLCANPLHGELARDGIDVVCSTLAVPRWQRALSGLPFPVRVHTPRSLASSPLSRGAALVIDARAARSPSSVTHRAVRTASHPFALARLPPSRLAAPDAVFAVTDVIAPGTFATPREARALQRHGRDEFLRRRDAALRSSVHDGSANAPPEATSAAVSLGRGLAWLVVVTRERPSVGRALATVVARGGTVHVHPGPTRFDSLVARAALDTSVAAMPPEALDAIARDDADLAARTLTRDLARLARAYAARIDATPRPRRAALGDEFSARSLALLRRARLRVCITVLASVTIPDDAAL